jgi:hypothetical protein
MIAKEIDFTAFMTPTGRSLTSTEWVELDSRRAKAIARARALEKKLAADDKVEGKIFWQKKAVEAFEHGDMIVAQNADLQEKLDSLLNLIDVRLADAVAMGYPTGVTKFMEQVGQIMKDPEDGEE